MGSIVRYILSVAALSVAVMAQSTTEIHLLVVAASPTQIPLYDHNLAGSIVDANALATTIAVDCVSSVSDCPFTTPWTVTQGPSTYHASVALSSQTDGATIWVTAEDDCKITASASISCSASVGIAVSVHGASTSSSTITHTVLASAHASTQTLLITGGVDKLNQPQATQTPTGAAGRMGVGGAVAVAAVAAVGIL
jgi:hypothetical protein